MGEILGIIIYFVFIIGFISVSSVVFALLPDVVMNTLGFFFDGFIKPIIFLVISLILLVFFAYIFKYIKVLLKGTPEEKNKARADFILMSKPAAVAMVVLILGGVYANWHAKPLSEEINPAKERNEMLAEEAETYEGMEHADALQCEMAKDFAGKTALVKGSVKEIYQAKESDGSPTFIDLDYEYPNEKRVTLIIWGENLKKMERILNKIEYDDVLFVTGTIEIYDGVAQIEVSKPSQIEFE